MNLKADKTQLKKFTFGRNIRIKYSDKEIENTEKRLGKTHGNAKKF